MTSSFQFRSEGFHIPNELSIWFGGKVGIKFTLKIDILRLPTEN